jgi:hypothetical protein
MNDRNGRYARIRYTATGAVAALVIVGVIAGTAALAAKTPTKPHHPVAVPSRVRTKTPALGVPDKTGTPPPPANPQPFLNAVQQLVDNGTITAADGQALDRQIAAGRIDTDTLAGFTPAQLQAVQQALGTAKRALAASVNRTSKAPQSRASAP